ncbi:MAG: hypothetical protein ACLT1J_13545 [Mediterraneibacter gnavus]
MEITKPGGDIYKMDPYVKEKGICVWKTGKMVGLLKMKNDTELGKMEVLWREKRYEIHYDPLTGTVHKQSCQNVEGV